MADYAFGIDLGTTYSCIAYVDADGKPFVIKNSEGETTTPSVVQFDGSNIVVGMVAKQDSVFAPDSTVSYVKRLIGKTDTALAIDGRRISPEEISAHILRKLARDAGEQLGTEVKNVVITCPAYFGAAEREATRTAGEMAGLNVLQIINEPTAAALFYGCTRCDTEKNVLVYDLGGGTFDITVIHVTNKAIQVVATDGNHSLGGKDWDDTLVEYFKNQFREQMDYDEEIDDVSLQDFLLKAERAKKTLSSKTSTKVSLDVNGIRCQIELTREKFDELTSVLVNETIDLTRKVLEAAAEKGVTQIDDFLFVGGSTRMPQIREGVEANFPYKPLVIDPDEAVAKGAALQSMANIVEIVAKAEEGQEQDERTREIAEGIKDTNIYLGGGAAPMPTLYDITSKSFALKVTIDNREVCYNMILRNDSVPCEVSQVFGILEDGQQTVSLEIYENDYSERQFEVDESLKAGDLLLEGLPVGLKAGSPIEVVIGLSRDGIITLTGRDKTGGGEISGTFQSEYAISAEDKSQAIQFIQNSNLSE